MIIIKMKFFLFYYKFMNYKNALKKEMKDKSSLKKHKIKNNKILNSRKKSKFQKKLSHILIEKLISNFTRSS